MKSLIAVAVALAFSAGAIAQDKKAAEPAKAAPAAAAPAAPAKAAPTAAHMAAISSSAWKVVKPMFLCFDSSWRMSDAGVIG